MQKTEILTKLNKDKLGSDQSSENSEPWLQTNKIGPDQSSENSETVVKY